MPILLVLLLLFTVLPLTEFLLLVRIHERIGLLATLALVLTTGVVGASLARYQGLRTLWRLREALARGQAPTDALLDGALILVAGAVLVTPGVLTDAFGFTLLIPPARALVKRGLRAWFAKNVRVVGAAADPPFTRPPTRDRGDVIDVEVVDVHFKGGEADSSITRPREPGA